MPLSDRYPEHVPNPDEVDLMSLELARLLTEAKEVAGLTFDELGNASGFGRATVVRWLNGERSPRIRDFYRLCAILHVDPRDLMVAANAAAGEKLQGAKPAQTR